MGAIIMFFLLLTAIIVMVIINVNVVQQNVRSGHAWHDGTWRWK